MSPEQGENSGTAFSKARYIFVCYSTGLKGMPKKFSVLYTAQAQFNIKGWINNKGLDCYKSKSSVETRQQDEVAMQERWYIFSAEFNSRLGSAASLPRIQSDCLWLQQSEPERGYKFMWSESQMKWKIDCQALKSKLMNRKQHPQFSQLCRD